MSSELLNMVVPLASYDILRIFDAETFAVWLGLLRLQHRLHGSIPAGDHEALRLEVAPQMEPADFDRHVATLLDCQRTHRQYLLRDRHGYYDRAGRDALASHWLSRVRAHWSRLRQRGCPHCKVRMPEVEREVPRLCPSCKGDPWAELDAPSSAPWLEERLAKYGPVFRAVHDADYDADVDPLDAACQRSLPFERRDLGHREPGRDPEQPRDTLGRFARRRPRPRRCGPVWRARWRARPRAREPG